MRPTIAAKTSAACLAGRICQLGHGRSIISGRSVIAITDTDDSENRHKTDMIVNSPSQLSIRMGKGKVTAVRVAWPMVGGPSPSHATTVQMLFWYPR